MVIKSILDSIKVQLGISVTETAFDNELLIFINTAFSTLLQLGLGSTGFTITSSLEEWDSLLLGRTDLEMVKTYIFLKTKLLFDPPTNSFLVDAIKTQIAELEFRIIVQLTPPVVVVEGTL